jgi:hypothetical protein
MTIVFSPATHRDAAGDSDLRITLVTAYSRAKSDKAKSLGFDFRASPTVVKDWGIRSGDKVTARMEDDGSWVFTIAMPTEKGYVVRIGGVRGHNGRKGYAYWRFPASPAVARQVMPEGSAMDLEFYGVEGRAASFFVVTKASGVEFVPTH